jgi:gamma-glutamyltranspeptidase/glutathione hydrolase
MMLRTQVWGQNPQTAADAPRWRVISGLDVALENSMDAATIQGLAALGHRVTAEAPEASFGFGGAQMVHRIDGGYVAGSDPRKDGCAAGF